MKRNRRPTPGNAFLLWNQLAWKTGAMMLASAQVIGHRTGRIAAAGARPSVRHQREFALMSQEKVEAALESAHAIASQLTAINARFGLQALENLAAGTSALASLAGSRTAGQMLARQAALLPTLGQPAMLASQLSNSFARLAHSGLAPIHARASANARRLRRR